MYVYHFLFGKLKEVQIRISISIDIVKFQGSQTLRNSVIPYVESLSFVSHNNFMITFASVEFFKLKKLQLYD